jgi:hypothetical protein
MTIPNYIRDPQLGLFESRPGDANVVWLETLLKSDTNWMTARQIIAACLNKLNDRGVRELASASPHIIPGQRGYRHQDCASIEESEHAANRMISQGKKMIQRGIAIRRNAHRKIG